MAQPDSKPVQKFDVSDDQTATIKPVQVSNSSQPKRVEESKAMPASPAKNISPEKIKARESAEKSAADERARVEQFLEDERKAKDAAEHKAREDREAALLKAQAEREVAAEERRKQIEAKELELRAEREVKEAEYKAMMESREAERQAAIEARKRQIEEERELAEQARLQREADYQAKLAIAKQEQEEAAAKRAEYEKERNVTNFLFLRLLKSILKDQRHIESLKQLLFSHRGFSIDEAFGQLDSNEDGLISGKEIQDVLTKYEFDVSDMQALIERLNKDHEVEISYSKFKEVITPLTKYPKNAGGYEGTFDQRETQKMAWLESLLEVLTAALSAQANHDALCEKFMLKGEDIFDDMDHYKVGYVTASAFGRWIQSNC